MDMPVSNLGVTVVNKHKMELNINCILIISNTSI